MTLKDDGIPPLNGLVMAGGKSKRMGTDKGLINWHGKEQRYHVADLLKDFCSQVFISCRQDQVEELDPAYQTLTDTFLDMGPYGGILSALRSQREKAWLVVACDLPLIDEQTLQFLINHRNPQEIATTYESPYDGLPEPLITIWEPHSYPVLLNFLGEGITCPRKALINSEKAIYQAQNPDALMNVNTPKDAEKANDILQKEQSILQ